MVWQFVAAVIVSLVIAYATRPKPQPVKPPGFSDVVSPTAEEGREIPVLFGTKWIVSPNCGWYGDIAFQAIKKKVG